MSGARKGAACGVSVHVLQVSILNTFPWGGGLGGYSCTHRSDLLSCTW